MQVTRKWGTLLLILLIGAFLRFWQIDAIPAGFHFDESFEGVEAWRILTDPGYRPIFLTGNFGVLPLNSYANAVMFAFVRLWGGEVGPVAMHITAGCLGLLTVIAVWRLSRELQLVDSLAAHPSLLTPPLSLAIFSAATLATMRWHVHFSRMGIEPIFVPLLWATSTGLLLHGWRTGSWLNFALAGVATAASMYSYQGAWILPLLIIPVALLLLAAEFQSGRSSMLRTTRGANKTADVAAPTDESRFYQPLQPHPRLQFQNRKVRGLLLAGLVAALVFAPLAWYFVQNPELFLLRPAQLATVGITDGAAGGEEQSTWQQVVATAKMFGPFGAPGDLDPRRNLPGQAALDPWMAIPFYLGLGISVWRIRQPTYSILLIGFVGLLSPGVFSEYAPHFHRILGAAAPVAILCGIGLEAIWQWCASRAQQPLQLLRFVAVGLLIASGLTTGRDYFTRWAPMPDHFYAFDVGLWQIGRWVAEQSSDSTIYLTPRTLDHPTLAFALQTSNNRPPTPITFDGRHIFPIQTNASKQSEIDQPEIYIVIQPEDFRTRLLLPEVFPQATILKEWLDDAGGVYATAYQRVRNEVPQRPPQQPLSLALGDGITLVGYDLQPAQRRRGEILYLQYHWQVTAVPSADWTIFTHLVDSADESGLPVVGFDSKPGNGSLITRRWQTGWRILDEVQLALPAELKAGEYRLRVGFYTADGQALPADGAGFLLGSVQIE